MNIIELIESLDWEDASDVDPCDGDECIIQRANGEYAFDKQSYGEWQHSDVIRWAFLEPNELLSKLIKG